MFWWKYLRAYRTPLTTVDLSMSVDELCSFDTSAGFWVANGIGSFETKSWWNSKYAQLQVRDPWAEKPGKLADNSLSCRSAIPAFLDIACKSTSTLPRTLLGKGKRWFSYLCFCRGFLCVYIATPHALIWRDSITVTNHEADSFLLKELIRGNKDKGYLFKDRVEIFKVDPGGEQWLWSRFHERDGDVRIRSLVQKVRDLEVTSRMYCDSDDANVPRPCKREQNICMSDILK